MSIIAIANGAGSAGKTTTATSLATLAAQAGRTVRLIDLDPQGNATTWVNGDTGKESVAEVLQRTSTIDQVEQTTIVDGLTLVPSAENRMTGLEASLSNTIGAEQHLRLSIEQARPVDTTIIDCPGSLGLLTLAGLCAADHVLTVVLPGLKELAGLPRITDLISQVKDAYRPKLALAGIVPCSVPADNAGNLYQDAMTLLHDTYSDLVTPSVRRTVKVPQSQAARQPLPLHDPKTPAADDYQDVYDWLDQRGLL